VDSTIARTILQRLVSGEFLEAHGERGGTRYVLASQIGVPSRIRYSESELEGLVLGLAADRLITNSDVREVTGLDRVAANRLLKRLVLDGRLQRLGQKRGTRYRRQR
jgi:predicted HTH transcriptional regulator